MLCVVDGTKYSDRKIPVAIRTTKEYSAISPSMKDQWSGKILSRKTRPALATPRRSSSSSTALPTCPKGPRAALLLRFVLAAVALMWSAPRSLARPPDHTAPSR